MYVLGPETWDTLELYWDLYLLTLLLGLLGLVMVLRRPRQGHHVSYYLETTYHGFQKYCSAISLIILEIPLNDVLSEFIYQICLYILFLFYFREDKITKYLWDLGQLRRFILKTLNIAFYCSVIFI